MIKHAQIFGQFDWENDNYFPAVKDEWIKIHGRDIFCPFNERLDDYAILWFRLDGLFDLPVFKHVVTASEEYRPDLTSYFVYQDPDLYWAILYRNRIASFEEFESGLELNIPLKASLENWLYDRFSEKVELDRKRVSTESRLRVGISIPRRF